MTKEQFNKAEELKYELKDFEHLLSHIDKDVTFLQINHHSVSKQMMRTEINKKYNPIFKKFFEEQIARIEKEFKEL